MVITKEQREYLDKLAISAIAELKLVAKNEVCYNCEETTELYEGNRKNLIFARCRLCSLKQVIRIRFNPDLPFKAKVSNLTPADDTILKSREAVGKLGLI